MLPFKGSLDAAYELQLVFPVSETVEDIAHVLKTLELPCN